MMKNKLSKFILITSLITATLSSVSASAAVPQNYDKLIEKSLIERAQSIKAKSSGGFVTEYDEALSVVSLMENVHNKKLKDYEYEFTVTSTEPQENGKILVSGDLTQYFYWENSSTKSGSKDKVTFTISSNNKIESASMPQSLLNKNDIIIKGKELKAEVKSKKSLSTNTDTEVVTTTDTQIAPRGVFPDTWVTYTYNRNFARLYAQSYALTSNPDYHTFVEDCTNFVSQALKYGGIPMRKTQQPYENVPNWWIQDGDAGAWLYSIPWVQATQFFQIIRSTSTIDGNNIVLPEDLSIGDVINYDKGNNGTMEHTAIVTDTSDPWEPLVSYHSSNRLDYPWDYYILNTPGTVIPYFTWIN